jgi:hypothetical protein
LCEVPNQNRCLYDSQSVQIRSCLGGLQGTEVPLSTPDPAFLLFPDFIPDGDGHSGPGGSTRDGWQGRNREQFNTFGLIQLGDKRSISRRVCDGISLVSGYCLVAVKAPIGDDFSQYPSPGRTPSEYLLKLSFPIIEKKRSTYADLHLTQLSEPSGFRQLDRIVPTPLGQKTQKEGQGKKTCLKVGFPDSL